MPLTEQEIATSIIYTFSAFISLAIVFTLFFYFSRKKILQQEIDKKNLEVLHQKELVKSIILTQEMERKRIAQDLHDDISAKLNVVSLNTHLLKSPDISNTELNSISDNIASLTNKALESSRKIAHGLFPPVLVEFGLLAGLEELVHEYNQTKQVTIHLTSDIRFENNDVNFNLQIFRILQELINNSIKHGKATSIDVAFHTENDLNTCTYKDNGKGFDTETTSKNGLGFFNIQSRVDFIKGTLQVESAINKGVHIIFTFK
jgi:signal transduction histidine kinase